MRRFFCGLFLALLWAAPAPGAEAERIGRIRNLDGEVWIRRNGASVTANVDGPLFRGDVIRTGWSGSVGLLLDDDTSVSLGSRSELALADFTFAPKQGRFALIMRMVKGTFSYLAGKIGKLSPESIQLQLPEATIGVRGTRLLVNVED